MNCPRLLIAATCLIASTFALAKSPPVQIWQPPRLVISSPANVENIAVQVQSVRLTGEVRGRHAWTEIDMTFYNPNRRVLEGELQFPLLDGQRIAGFAMDVNGVLRDAVPVEKSKGQAVFEDVIRGNIDPGLLEITQGNNFKLRVYPIPAQGAKRVVLRIAETLVRQGNRNVYRLPLAFGERIANLSVDVRIGGTDGKPLVTTRALGDLAFVAEGDGYRLRTHHSDVATEATKTLDITTLASTGPVTTTQTFEGRTYFIADIPVPSNETAREIPHAIGLIWDSSGSGAARDHGREFALLDAYFKKMRNGEVRLTRIRHDAEPLQVFPIANGNWQALRNALATTAYDGATNLGAFVPEAKVQEYLLFSDGLTNFGDAPFAKVGVPLYSVAATVKSDATFLRAIAHRRGGRFIDLSLGSTADAARALLTRATHVSAVTSNGAAQLVLSSPYPHGGRVLLGGVLNETQAPIRITLANTGGKSAALDVLIKANGNAGSMAAGQWAQLRAAELEGEYEFNRAEIRRLGQRFKLVTRETSLIVLDRIEDYARYEILPPAELRADYERVIGNIAQQRRGERKAHLDNIVRLFEEKMRWWNRDFPKNSPVKKEAKIAAADAVAPLAAGAVMERRAESSRDRGDADAPRRMALEALTNAAPAMAPLASPVSPAAPASAPTSAVPVAAAEPAKGKISGTLANATIRLQKWQADAPYALRMREAAAADLYRVYLDEKPGYANSTAFFLDAADVFFDKGEAALGTRVLTNLAEMDLENRHILRILGYRLMQAKQPALAIPVFRKVLALSPEEPQSYRDLGLAYAADRQPQKAIDALNEVVIRPWHNRFPEIELITLAELNSIVATAPMSPNSALDTSRIDARLLKNLPLDLRAVLTWDADNTDIDLWVTDPNGEKAYYGHRLTYQGGRMSADFTGGYGPEEFSLKTAKPGKYKVEANYFGDRRQNVTGATTLSLKLSTHFGTGNQQDQIVTMRLKDRREVIFVGEFEVK